MKQLIAKLVLMSSLLSAASALATTNSIWADNVGAAKQAAESAKETISRSNNCAGLREILEFGPSASGVETSGALGELKSQMLEIEVNAATVRFAAARSNDPVVHESLALIQELKTGVTKALVARVKFCGNGVERGQQQ